MKCRLKPGVGVKTKDSADPHKVLDYIRSCGIHDGSLNGNSNGSVYGLHKNGEKATCGESEFYKIISFEEFEKLISLPEVINYDVY